MNHGISRSILAVSLLAIGIAVSVPAGSQTGGAAGSSGAGAGADASSGQGSSAGQGAASSSGQGSNAPAQSGTRSSSQTNGTGQRAAAATTSGAGAADRLASSDQKFVNEAAKGGIAEVKLGQLAVSKAQSSEVKQFAERMIDDHTKANDKLMQLAAQKGMHPSQEMDSATQREYNKLEKLSGAQFDQEYMKHMVSDHEKDIKEFQKAAQSAKDPDVKSFAQSTLPTLQDHLSNAKSAEAAAKSEKRTASK